MNAKLHALSDANGRSLSFFMTARQISDYTDAAAILDELPEAQWMFVERGYDADWFRDSMQKRASSPAFPAENDKIRQAKILASQPH